MDWLNGFTGRTGGGPVTDLAIDYSYVFGTRSTGQRHDPHVHTQQQRVEPDLLTLAALIREKPPAI